MGMEVVAKVAGALFLRGFASSRCYARLLLILMPAQQTETVAQTVDQQKASVVQGLVR
jgi:hypothetical protein